MLVEFRVKNFRSFKDEQVLSLVAGSGKGDDDLAQNCIETGKLKLVRTAAVYGPNAAGKSNLVQALSFMRNFVLKSANEQAGVSIDVVPFRLDAHSAEKPSEFEITFIFKDIRYQYGFVVTQEKVHDEWLYAFPNGQVRAQTWVKRLLNPSKNEKPWTFSTYLKGQNQQIKELTRPNALFLSVAAKFAHEQLTPVFSWFKDQLRIVTTKYPLRPITANAFLSEKLDVGGKTAIKEAVRDFLKNADLGIIDVEVTKVDLSEIGEGLSETVRKGLITMLEEDPPINIQVMHHNPDTGSNVVFDFEDESAGTQRMFLLAIPWMVSVVKGITIVVDELESSLHPLLSRALVEYIQSPPLSKSTAQLVFATHDTTLLDPSLLRRDQVWFVEKDRKGASHLYPLLDYKPRAGEALQKGYLAGRYGAIPVLRKFSE